MVSGDKITFVIAWYTFIVSVIYQSGHCQDIVKCMKCHRVTSIEFCEEMEICDARNQVCFVEQNIEIGGTIVITAGCRDKQVCDALGCYGETYDGHVAPNSTYFGAPFQCHHCCAGDFCNIHGCPELHDISQHTWTRCVKCDHVVKPEECEKLTTCGPHETCVQETLSHGSEVRYSLRCMEKAKCDLLDTIHNMGKRNYVPTWAECCRNHLCNGYKPMMQADPVINLPTYTCPPGPKVTTGPPTAKTTSTTTLKPTTTSTPQPTTTSTPKPTTTSTAQPTTTSAPQPTTRSTPQPTTTTTPQPTTTSTPQPTTTSTPQPTTTPRPTAETTLLSTTTTPLQTTTTLSQSTSSSIFTSTLVVTTTSTVNSLSPQPVGGSTSSGTTTHVTTLNSQSILQNISTSASTVSQTASSSSPSPITTAQSGCVDQHSDCNSFDKDVLCTDPSFVDFAKENCALYCGLCVQGGTTEQPLQTAVIVVTQASSPPSGCQDKDADCNSYDKDMLCSDPSFQEFAKDKCAMYCGFCGQGTTGQQTATTSTTQPTTSTTTQPVCKDMSTDCSSYDKDMLCSDPAFKEFAKVTCAMYCGFCGQGTTGQQTATTSTTQATTSTTTQSVCRDMSTDCSSYDKDMLCSDPAFKEFAKVTCAMYCGFCGQGTTGQQNTTALTTQSSTTSTKSQPVCKDMSTDCSNYDKDMLCSDPSFQEFAKDNCAIYCGYCGQGTTVQQPAASTSIIQLTTMITQPPATSTTTQPVCKDMSTDCSSYDKDMLCSDPSFQEFAKNNCAMYCGFCGQGTTSQQTATTSTTQPTTSTTTQPVCKDITTDCSSYDKDMLCSDPSFQEFAKDNCAMYCGFCGQGTTDQQPQTAVVVVTRPVSSASAVATTTLTQTSTQSVCKDMTTDCNGFDKNVLCSDPAFQEYAKDNCAMYCGFCGQVTTRDPPTTSTVKSTSSIVSTVQATIHPIANTTLDVSATTTHQTLALVNSTTPSTNLITTVSNTTPVVETSSSTIAASSSQSVLSSITSFPISTPLSLLTTNQQSCVDIDPGCTSYGYSYICQQESYKQWAMENCRNFCGFCNVPTTPPPCIDENPSCDQYGGKDYICADGYRDWALANCKKFCGLCSNSTGNKRYVKDMTDMVEVAVPVKQPEKSFQTNKSANEA